MAKNPEFCRIVQSLMTISAVSRFVLGFSLCSAVHFACAQEIPLRIGETVPALHFAEVFQARQVVPRKGHPLLIEYWTTSCVPCIAGIPRLNALIDEFGKQGVDFLMLTNETSAKVVPFLKKHPMKGMVASDPGFSTNRLLAAPGTPFTLLINSDNKLAAITLPDRVTPDVLHALVAGVSIPLASLDLRLETNSPTSPHTLFSVLDSADASSAVFVVVRPGADGPLGSIGGISDFKGSLRLRDLLTTAYRVAPQQIDLPGDLDAVYSVRAWVPPFDTAGVMPIIRTALLSAANLRVREETRPIEVVVVKKFPGTLKPEPGGVNTLNDLIEAREGRIRSVGGVHTEVFRDQLERQLRKPVVLEGATEGTYAVDIRWEPNDRDSIRRAFDAAGMSLQYEMRPFKILVFSAAEKAQP